MVHGTVAEGFEGVREAFEANFTQRGEVGAAFAVHRHGEVVVDLWAGTADRETGRAWERDTRGIVFSVTKGLVAMRFLQLLDQGLFDPDAPIAETWPEFGVRGKQTITGRMVLNHRAGLSAVDAPITTWDFADAPDKVHDALVQQRPLWVPGSAQGYAATTYGAYTNEMLERLTGQRFSEALAEHIAAPLGLALASGVPEDEAGEVATLIPVGPKDVLRRHLPTALTRRTHEGRLFRRLLNRSTDARRAFQHPRMSFGDVNKPGHLALDLPWMGVVSSAHDISRAYAGLLGHIDGVNLVSPKTLEKVFPRQSWSGLSLIHI